MLAQLLNAHYNQNSEDLKFWLEAAARDDTPILELGCGTGRVSSAIAKAGREVYGIDRDHEMLIFLSKDVPATIKAFVHVVQAQMTAFHFSTRFGKILLPCNTYSTLNFPERIATLKNVFHHLDQDGVFITSIPNPAVLFELPEEGEAEFEGIISQPETKTPVQIFSSWEKSSEWVKMSWHYDHLQPDGMIERVTVSTFHSLISKGDYLNEMRNAGFNDLKVYGDYDYSTYDRYSPYLILIAGK